jgi:energy-coupling factor transporter ATP-binding protein EcfA2
MPDRITKNVQSKSQNPDSFEHDFVPKTIPRITIEDFLETLCGMHFASLVPGPIDDASGLMVVGPSGSLKSSLLIALNSLYPDSSVCDSNWYYGKIVRMKGAFYNKAKRSIIVPELASLYAGDPRTGTRMEQMLQQLAGEGCIATQAQDTRWERYEMRSQIFAAMTPEFADKKHKSWEEGFHRRFLWAHIGMENEEVLMDYLTAWKRAEIEVSQPMIEPAQKHIPQCSNYEERMELRSMLDSQSDFGPNHTRYAFFVRTFSALKWHYSRIHSTKSALDTMRRFSVCLSRQAALLIVPEEKKAISFRDAVANEQIAAGEDHRKKL